MHNAKTKCTDGTAVSTLSVQLRHELQVTGVRLQRYAKTYGTRSSDYKTMARDLEAAKNLYKGLCGDERPFFTYEARHG